MPDYESLNAAITFRDDVAFTLCGIDIPSVYQMWAQDLLTGAVHSVNVSAIHAFVLEQPAAIDATRVYVLQQLYLGHGPGGWQLHIWDTTTGTLTKSGPPTKPYPEMYQEWMGAQIIGAAYKDDQYFGCWVNKTSLDVNLMVWETNTQEEARFTKPLFNMAKYSPISFQDFF
jgi:hypothetical protein